MYVDSAEKKVNRTVATAVIHHPNHIDLLDKEIFAGCLSNRAGFFYSQLIR